MKLLKIAMVITALTTYNLVANAEEKHETRETSMFGRFEVENTWSNRNTTSIIANIPCDDIFILNAPVMKITVKAHGYGWPKEKIQLVQKDNEVVLSTKGGIFYDLKCSATATIPPGFKLSLPNKIKVSSIIPAPIIVEKDDDYTTFGGILIK